MKISAPRSKGESGQALITAIIFLLALTFMGFGLIAMSTMDISSSRNLRLADEALDASEEGVLMGMAYAGNNSTFFVLNANEGDTVRLNSTVTGGKDLHDRAHYDVLLTMGGRTEQPPGEIKSGSKTGPQMSSFMFVAVKVQSRGLVSEGAKSSAWQSVSAFDWSKRPMINRNMEVTFRVRKASW